MDQVEPGLKFCPDCAAQMPDSAAFCPGCGRSMRVQLAPDVKVPVPRNNIAGALAYVTLLPALLFLFLPLYRKDAFVRFHSLQCLLCWVVGVAAAAALRLLAILLSYIPVVGPLITLLLVVIIVIAVTLTWIVLLVKAFQGQMFALPVIGAIAEQYSAASSDVV